MKILQFAQIFCEHMSGVLSEMNMDIALGSNVEIEQECAQLFSVVEVGNAKYLEPKEGNLYQLQPPYILMVHADEVRFFKDETDMDEPDVSSTIVEIKDPTGHEFQLIIQSIGKWIEW